ncbi:GNAT family N-acetyltransferase [Arthrobacter mobilis]|uniref:GNAT family N-acetyltransferase n=1 Tax=Arthrobacter mobilis TaxID=2724944 RepID=A0A7X6K7X0_9MICC|nr:GNAT family N-acetyltransferase [Arthrobacter mobilis]NKX56771.1 GNAT family N-acetyltransferase [Arthrobacter mobilis]
MAELTFRDWRDGDDLALLQIWGDPETGQAGQFRSVLRPPSDTPWSRCIVAEDQGIPVAAGALYETSLHPERLWLYIEVAKDHRRAGVGTAILERLRAEAEQAPSGATRLRAKVEPGSSGAGFAAAAGLQPIQRSRVVVVQPGALPAPDLTDDAGPALEEAATGSVELTQAVVKFYNGVHGWDRSEMTVGKAQQMLLSEGAGASGAVVLRDAPRDKGGTIQAFAISYTHSRTDAPSDVLLGYDPELGPAAAQDAVAKLLAMLVHQYPVQLEVDDAMTALTAVLEPLLAAGTASVAGAETVILSS